MTFENSIMEIHNYSGTSNETQEITSDTGENPVTIAIFICLGIIGCLGNGFVLYVFCSSEKLRQSIVNIYLINQSAIDLMASLMIIVTAKGLSKATDLSSDRIEGKLPENRRITFGWQEQILYYPSTLKVSCVFQNEFLFYFRPTVVQTLGNQDATLEFSLFKFIPI